MTIDRTYINTRTRALSTDVNRLIALINRAIQEGLHGLCSTAGLRQSGILHGFQVTAVGGGTMGVNITPGLAFVKRAAVYPGTQWAWTELQDTKVLTLDPGGANPRYDVIEMRAGEVVSATQGRDVFNPNLGTFSLQNLTVEYKSEPEFRIVKGTEAFPIPGFPAGSAGWCPIAYISVGPGVVTLTNANIGMCRPILSPDPMTDKRIEGGGLNWDADGFTGAHQGASGRFARSRLNWSIAKGTVARLGLYNIDGGSLPVANTVLYAYAIPPPYPTGYDTDLAAREINSTNSTFYINGGGFELGQRDCLVVFSAAAPNDVQSLQGAPSGNGTLSNPIWNGGANAIDRGTWVYLGACYFDVAVPGIVIQRARGPWIGTFRKPGFDFTAALPIVVPAAYNVWSNIVGDSDITWPNTAMTVVLGGLFDNNPGGYTHVRIEDWWTGGGKGLIYITHTNGGGVGAIGGQEYQVGPSLTGNINITIANALGVAGNQRFYGRRYEDSVLARR